MELQLESSLGKDHSTILMIGARSVQQKNEGQLTAPPRTSEAGGDEGEMLGGMEEGGSPSKEVVKREMADFLKE